MAARTARLKVSFSPSEKDEVAALAQRLRLSRSELLRRLVLARRLSGVRDFELAQGIRDLLKVNADLARLGNLLKLALAEDALPQARIDVLSEQIFETQGALKRLAADLHRRLHS